MLESDTLHSGLFQKYSLGLPRERGQPIGVTGDHTAATPTLLPCFTAGKRQSRNSNEVRTKNILSSLLKAISSVQPFALKDKLINNPVFYRSAPPRTPLMITQHF